MDTQTTKVFNAGLQRETEHTVDIDGSGEIVLTCTETGAFLKLPAGTDAAGLKAYVEAHKASNEGQVTQESLDAKKAELLKGLLGDAPAV